MNNSIEQINTLHELITQFNIKRTVVEDLIQQIDDKKNVEQLDRFFKGLSYEDHFEQLFSGFPCVIGITGLKQKQNEGYKRVYQVPDYIIIVQSITNKPVPLLIDVKTVNIRKLKCELQKKQVVGLVNYSNTLGINILLSIYWHKKHCWTLNSINHFTKKNKNYVLTFEDAFKENISHVLGDFLYLFDKPFTRKRVYQKNERIKNTGNIEYGELEEVAIEIAGNIIVANTMDSAIIDSILLMSKPEISQSGDITVITDSFSGEAFLIQLSLIVMSLLGTTNKKVNDSVGDTNIVDFVISFIDGFIQKLDVKRLYNIPDIKTPDIELVFDSIYENTTANKILKNQKEKII